MSQVNLKIPGGTWFTSPVCLTTKFDEYVDEKLSATLKNQFFFIESFKNKKKKKIYDSVVNKI